MTVRHVSKDQSTFSGEPSYCDGFCKSSSEKAVSQAHPYHPPGPGLDVVAFPGYQVSKLPFGFPSSIAYFKWTLDK